MSAPTLASIGLSHRELQALARALNPRGTVGMDAERASVPELVAFIERKYDPAAIAAKLDVLWPDREPKQAVPPVVIGEDAPRTLDATPADVLAAAIRAIAETAQPKQAPLDENAVRAIVEAQVEAALRGRPATKHEVTVAGVTTQIDGHLHPVFDDVLALASNGLNVMLKGPAGCGKTYLAAQLAKAMDRPFGTISGTGGVSEAQLVGRLVPSGEGGRFEYVASDFIRHYTGRSLFLFDEIDAFDSNCLLTVNTATANGGIHVEARAVSGLDTYVARHPEAVLLASANTFGTGPDAIYVGRNQLDAATLDRWYVVEMDYDRGFEAALATDAAETRLVEWVWSVREKAAEARLRRVVSTRMIQRALVTLRMGWKADKVKAGLLTAWTRDERTKVGA